MRTSLNDYLQMMKPKNNNLNYNHILIHNHILVQKPLALLLEKEKVQNKSFLYFYHLSNKLPPT
jgi:hypothetical protein